MPYNTAVVEGLISFISKALNKNEQKSITDWINKNILITSSRLDLKQAFVKAQKIIFAEYITKGNIANIKSLLDAINACENEKLKKLLCEILSDVYLDQKEFVSADIKLHQELIDILNNQYENIENDELKESISGKIQEVRQIMGESIGGIEGPNTQAQEICQIGDPHVIKKQKWYIHNFIEKLFKINMSQDVLVDIVINDDPTNSYNNQTTIVGRPKVLGSSTKQMRHVTPYSFIAAAIKTKIDISEVYDGYKSYVTNLVKATKPLLKNKKGICLTNDQYSKLSSNITLQDEESERFKLSTTSNEYHLIYNNALIEQFKKCGNFSEAQKDKAEADFSTKFEKYVTYGIKYLTEGILDSQDINTMTIVCEGIARIILTLFNQEKYAAFPEEGNSLKEEIRVYDTPEDAKQATKLKLEQQKYEVISHNEITQENILQYDSRIRIVDNEGLIVRKVVEVLKIINSLMHHKLSEVSDETKKEDEKYQKDYNEKYNFKVNDQNLKCKDEYNKDIDIEKNLVDIFQYHVAKHLYSVFDFKPLEKKVLAPKQHGDTDIIKVYTSAGGQRQAEYSVQDGIQYRTLEVNGARGYNDDAVFRSEINNEKTILKDKVVNHVIISLLPFDALKVECIFNESQCKGTPILQAFCELVKVKYKAEEMIQLDDAWMINVQNECSKYFEDVLLGDVSKPIDAIYDV